ncbi:Tol-Pal system subunit TolQ [candidate division BRC1 bacterium HGW-BRC1-1]|jgi:biopolymer transport protein TolQ|nr:MAG: Tol-Pal system subunit TolQ [candidate division BRC1 bacterium HGW-BRC1-1]
MLQNLSLIGIDAVHVNIFQAIGDSDFIGILCLIGCLILSVISWAIVFYKFFQFGAASRQSDHFIDKCVSGSLEEAYRHTSNYPDSPLARILREAYLEMKMEDWYNDPELTLAERLSASRSGLERVVEKTVTTEIRRLESYVIFLATTASAAPFIGLFGTVWGVLGAFQAMSRAGSAALQALAPGMATALVATIAGLIAAIPASVFFNVFTNKISIMIARMDAFSLELNNIILKRILRDGRD